MNQEDAKFVNTGLGTNLGLIPSVISCTLPRQQQRSDTEALRTGQFIRRSLRDLPLQKRYQELAMRTTAGPPAAILSSGKKRRGGRALNSRTRRRPELGKHEKGNLSNSSVRVLCRG